MPRKPKNRKERHEQFLDKISTETSLLSDLKTGSITAETLAAIQQISQQLKHKYSVNNSSEILSLLGHSAEPGIRAALAQYKRIVHHDSNEKRWQKRQLLKSLRLKSSAIPEAAMAMDTANSEQREQDNPESFSEPI